MDFFIVCSFSRYSSSSVLRLPVRTMTSSATATSTAMSSMFWLSAVTTNPVSPAGFGEIAGSACSPTTRSPALTIRRGATASSEVVGVITTVRLR